MQNRNLTVIAFANGFTLWQYNTRDNIKDVETDGYFDSIKAIAATGDIIIITAEEDGKRCSCFRSIVELSPKVKLGMVK